MPAARGSWSVRDDAAPNWLALSAIGVATVVIANDFSAINVALPTMERDFDTNINRIQWVGNAYALMFGVMIVIFLLVVTVVGIGSFPPLERRAGRHALVPLEILRNRAFAASCFAILLMSATFFASLLYLPQFMEHQLGYSPLQSGLGMLPALATFTLVSFTAGPLYGRLGAKTLASVGAAGRRAQAEAAELAGVRPRRPQSSSAS